MSACSLIRSYFPEFSDEDFEFWMADDCREQGKLLSQFVNSGKTDMEILQKLFLSYLPLAYKISRSYASHNIPVRRVFEEGYLGILAGLFAYEAKKSINAKYIVTLKIKQSIRENVLKRIGVINTPSHFYNNGDFIADSICFEDLVHNHEEKMFQSVDFEIITIAHEFREQAVSLFNKIRLMSLACKVNAKRNWDIFRKVTGIPVPNSSADFFGSEPKKQCSVIREFGMCHQGISKIVNQILEKARELDPRIGNTVREFLLFIDSYYAALEIIAAYENKTCS